MTENALEATQFERDSFQLIQSQGYAKLERWKGNAELRQRFPLYASKPFIQDGYFNPMAGWGNSSLAVKQLAEDAKDLGAIFCLGVAVTAFLSSGGVRIQDDQGYSKEIVADRVIVAAGAWTPALIPEVRPVMEAHGQPVIHLRVPLNQKAQLDTLPVFAMDIATTGFYGFPPATEKPYIKIAKHSNGYTHYQTLSDGHRVSVPTSPSWIPEKSMTEFRAFIRKFFPEFQSFPIEKTRICWYADTWDGDFYIDYIPRYQGRVMIASGGSGHGFKFTPVLGPLIADVLEGKSNRWAHRFRWRKVSSGIKVTAERYVDATPRQDLNEVKQAKL